jgi:putative Holliday junction resolvase
MTSGKLMGIDHGLKRIGLAVCDESRLIARELTIINRKSKAEDFARINHIATEQRVVAFVVGIPTNYEGAPGIYSQADKVKTWVGHLAETTTLPIVLWDEQLTSEDAKELARQKRRKPDAPIDDLAARIILQSYIDALRDGLAEAPPQ